MREFPLLSFCAVGRPGWPRHRTPGLGVALFGVEPAEASASVAARPAWLMGPSY